MISRTVSQSDLVLTLLLTLGLAACANLAEPPLPPMPVHANGQVLWKILHESCVPNQVAHNDPAPCARVDLAGGADQGFVVLKDRSGVAQHLVMPTAKVTGIEDPLLLQPGTTNYFARAWEARHYVEDKLGLPLSATQMSVAVNSLYGRSQDQLHLHVDCVDATVGAVLRTVEAPAVGWSHTAVTLKGHPYRFRWIDADELATTSPFELLARDMPGARANMAAWTLALVGAERSDGAKGFLLLADRADAAHHDDASSEDLQDHDCRQS